MASSTPGRRRCPLGADQLDALDLLGGAVAHQVLLEAARAGGGRDAGAHGVLGHGQHPRRHAQAGADLARHPGQAGPLGQPQGAVDVGGQVAVAEPEPGLAAVGRQPLEAAEAVVGVAPAARVGDPRQHVGADVEVGADAQAVEVPVVAGVDHHRQPRLALDLGEPVDHLGAPGPPRQGQDHGRRAGAGMLTGAPASLSNRPPAGRAAQSIRLASESTASLGR